ncbi:hypothetical protein U1Q18_036058 [Sarracenia purpurea var. burkii]
MRPMAAAAPLPEKSNATTTSSSKIEVAYQEAVSLKRKEELIREEEAAWLAEIEQKARRVQQDSRMLDSSMRAQAPEQHPPSCCLTQYRSVKNSPISFRVKAEVV